MLQSMRSAAKYVWIILIVAFVGGFLFVENSGLIGRAPVTTNTVVATVNGEDILYVTWQNAVTNLEQQESQRLGRGVSLDERQELENRAFDELVNDILLRQEYERRGISVTDEEILQAAQFSPPPGLEQNPDFQTDGQFDITKYQRFLASPVARQQGLLFSLEQFYRSEIPRQKLYDQISSDAWMSDARLWQVWSDRNDSAQVSYVTLRPESVTDAGATISDSEVSSFYNNNRSLFERPGRAVLSLLTIDRQIGPADTVATLRRVTALREEILGGASFADVAARESEDSISGANGGALGRGGRGRFVEPFESTAYSLPVGQISEPVLSAFGYHLIQVESRDGDTLDLRHLLIGIRQSDSTATLTDRRADELANIASGSDDPARFDSAAVVLALAPTSVVAIEGEPVSFAGRMVPGASAWAFSGSETGESSDLFDGPDAYFLARLDSLTPGGLAPLNDVKEEIRRRLEKTQRLKALEPVAQTLADAAKRSNLEQAAAELNLSVEQTEAFTRLSLVQGLGQFSEAVGAAFGTPVGSVSAPVSTRDAVYVLRVDRRVPADSAAFVAGLPGFRNQLVEGLRTERVQTYLGGLRENAKIIDKRRDIQASLRRQVVL